MDGLVPVQRFGGGLDDARSLHRHTDRHAYWTHFRRTSSRRASATIKLRHYRMAKRTGSADLPLHGGRVPPWLSERMTALGAIITQAIVHQYGRDAFLQRLSHPFWFQAFGAVMGMDWHSSGITTSVIGALKRGLAPMQAELGIHVCGGRGRHSRRTPEELMSLGERVGFDGLALTRPAASSQRSTAPLSRMDSTSTFTVSSSPTTASGRLCSRA